MHNVAAALSTSLSPRPRDLTDPAQGPHAMQRMLRAAADSLARATSAELILDRSEASPLPAVTLRRALAGSGGALVVRPRVVGEGRARRHQLELWWIRRHAPLGLRDLGRCVAAVTAATAPGFTVSAVPLPVPHADEGRSVDVRLRGTWVSVGTAGLVDPALLARAGLPEDASGVVLTLDLERLVLLAKGIDDRALLSSEEPAVAAQMLDLEPYVPPALARRFLLVARDLH